jgi:hypothetical protein
MHAVLEALTTDATGMPVLDAQADFRRPRRRHAVARLGRWLTSRGSVRHPLTIDEGGVIMGGGMRLEVVPLRAIVGTLEPSIHFDRRFRPGSEVLRNRSERVALAHRRGDPLPPIKVLARDDGYYVVDGRHRVSVALALGHPDIDAWVTGGASRQPITPRGRWTG